MIAKMLSKTDEFVDGFETSTKFVKTFTKDVGSVRNVTRIVDDTSMDAAEKLAKFRSLLADISKTMDDAARMTTYQQKKSGDIFKEVIDEGDKLDEFVDGARNLSKTELDTVAKNTVKAADDVKESSGMQPFKWIMENKKKVAAALGVAGLATTALVMYELKNAKKFNIIAIEDVSKGSTIKTMFTIETEHKFSNKGTCRIDGTDSVPIITPGNYKIDSVKEDNKIIIITKEKVTTPGTKGTFTYYTTFENELAGAVHEVVKGTVAVGAAVGTGVGGGILDGLGLGVSEDTLNIIFYVILGVVALAVGAFIFKRMKSKKEGSESSDS